MPILLHIIGASGNAYLLFIAQGNIICMCPDKHPFCKHILFLIADFGFPLIPGLQSLCFPAINDRIQNHQSNKQLDDKTSTICSTLISKSCFHCKRTTSKCPLFICNRCNAVFHHRHAKVIVSSLCPCCRKEWLPLLSVCDGKYRNFYGILSSKGYLLTDHCRTRFPAQPSLFKREQVPVPQAPVLYPNQLPVNKSHVIPPSPPPANFGQLSQLL